jgi:hypothetical protein
MQQLLATAHINDTELKSILNRIPGEELLRLSESCYCPNLRSSNLGLIHGSGLTRQNIAHIPRMKMSFYYMNHADTCVK